MILIFIKDMGDNYKLYNILEINKNASDDEIKSAYKKKAMQYHPDKNNGDAESANKFKEIICLKQIVNS